MLSYTGHPLVDVGFATILAFARKQTLSELTAEDLDNCADYIEQHYFKSPMKDLLTVLLPNSAYTQSKLTPETKRQFIDVVIRGYRRKPQELQEVCVYTGKPAVTRAYREHIPLLASPMVNNFYPNGRVGLPICGEVALATQTMPLGTRYCGGRFLAVHSDNNELMQDFARRFFEDNTRQISLIESRPGSEKDKTLNIKGEPRTVLIETLVNLQDERHLIMLENLPVSITAYWFKNYGREAAIDILHLPSQVVGFVALARSFHYKTWQGITSRAWHRREGDKAPTNRLYQDLFSLPSEARRFIRTHLLCAPTKGKDKDNSLDNDSLIKELHLVSWELTELFLEEIMNLDRTRVRTIQDMGDALALYARNHDLRIVNRLFHARYFRELSYELSRAKRESVAKGEALFTFDQFIEVFAESEETPRLDWSLARDLVLIRMFDQLSDILHARSEELEDLSRDETALDWNMEE